MKRLAPALTVAMALLFCGLHVQGGGDGVVEVSFSLFMGSCLISLLLYTFPIVVGGMTGWKDALRTWLRWDKGTSVGALVVLFALFLFILECCFAVLPEMGLQDSVQLLTTMSIGQKFLLVFPLCLLVPLCEELLFRGFLLHALPVAIGLPLSSVLFACAHGLNLFVLPLFLFGWFLGLLALRTKSLLPSVLFHGLFNALTLVFA